MAALSPLSSIPTILITPLMAANSTAEAKAVVAKELLQALRGSGFFLASGHGVDVDSLHRVTRQFHDRVTDTERWSLAIKAYRDDASHIRNGFYLAMPKEKKAVESFCFLNPSFTAEHEAIRAGLPFHEVNKWPDEAKHPGFKAFQERYYWAVFDVAQSVLRGIALALGKPEAFFDDYFRKTDTLSAVSLIRYPRLDPYPADAIKTADDGAKLSFEWHVDVSLLTVLYQSNVQNLQVKTPSGWLDIPSSPDCFLINVGGYMQHITNGFLISPIHRVKWVNEERLSLPFFANLGISSTIEPFDPAPIVLHSQQATVGVKMTKENDPKADNASSPLSFGDYFHEAFHAIIKKNGQT